MYVKVTCWSPVFIARRDVHAMLDRLMVKDVLMKHFAIHFWLWPMSSITVKNRKPVNSLLPLVCPGTDLNKVCSHSEMLLLLMNSE